MQRENAYQKVLNLQDKVSILRVPARKANHDSPHYVKQVSLFFLLIYRVFKPKES